MNDVAREEVVAPFNFPILKTEDELQNDLNEAIQSEPFLFLRSQDVVSTQISIIEDYFSLVKRIQFSNNKLAAAKDSLYRNRFSDQYEISRMSVQSDSTALAVLMNRIQQDFVFASNDDKWNAIFLKDPIDELKYRSRCTKKSNYPNM